MFGSVDELPEVGGGVATLIDADTLPESGKENLLVIKSATFLDLEEAIALQNAENVPQKVIQILRRGEVVATRSYGNIDWSYQEDRRRA